MPKRQLQLSFPRVPTLKQRLLAVIEQSTHCVLTLDGKTLTLKPLHWPVHGTKRVAPDEWHVYRKNYQFLGPCCLCPLFRPLSEEPRYIEAAVYLPLHGRYKGEWVAECAKGRCGYLVLLEKFYPKIGLPVKRYPVRDVFTACPPPCLHYSEENSKSRSPGRPLKRTYAQADLNDAPPLGVTAVDLHYETDWRKIVRLDRLERPGLTEKEFFGLFAKCDACGLVMARLVFRDHECRSRPLGEDGLELTDCEEEEERCT